MTLLRVTNLQKSFGSRRTVFRRQNAPVHAVQGATFDVRVGETFALVGESGAGKSTVGRLVMRLIEPDAGEVSFDGQDVRAFDAKALFAYRRDVQMIYQDPYGTFNPRYTVGESVAEPLVIHQKLDRAASRSRVLDLVEQVGLLPDHLDRYPGELSGGQLQRLSIARALTLGPRLIICDEPLSALDMSIQAQVMNLLRQIQQEFGLSYLFVSHDLSLVQVIADRVAVMNRGRIVETGQAHQVYESPQDEYTQRLLASIPVAAPWLRATRRTGKAS